MPMFVREEAHPKLDQAEISRATDIVSIHALNCNLSSRMTILASIPSQGHTVVE